MRMCIPTDRKGSDMSKKKLDELGVSAFCESMAMMVHSGIQTDEAVSLLQSSSREGVLSRGLAVMKEQVDNGSSLGAAMKESGIFPRYALQMVAKEYHVHGEACYTDGVLTCGQLEIRSHQHTAECWQDVQVLVSGGHVHNEECVKAMLYRS